MPTKATLGSPQPESNDETCIEGGCCTQIVRLFLPLEAICPPSPTQYRQL